MSKNSVNAITLGGLFTAIYAVITIISVYFLQFVSIIGLLFLPIFSAYFTSIYKYKETIAFNFSVMLVCFLVVPVDPFYLVLYVLPPLLVGDLFGVLNKLKIKFYTTIFLQTIMYSLTNIMVLYLAEIFYEMEIIKFLIIDPFIYQNFSLTILYILSGAEAIFSSLFINEKLSLLNIKKEKEDKYPIYGYISCVILFLLILIFYNFSYNLYFLFSFMFISISFIIIYNIISKIKHKNLLIILTIIFFFSLSYLLCYLKYYYLIILVFIFPIALYSLVKIFFYIYNIRAKEREK